MATWQMGSKSIPGGGSLTHTPAVMHYSLWSKSSSGELGFPLHRKHTEVILRLQESQRAQNTIGASPLLGQETAWSKQLGDTTDLHGDLASGICEGEAR